MNPIIGNYRRYALALGLVAASILLRFAIEKLVGEGLPAFITFYPIIMYIALVAGLGPGLLATAVSAILADYFILTPYVFGNWNPRDAASMILFTGMGVFMSLVAHRYRKIRDRLETLVADRTDELNRANATLKKQNEEYFNLLEKIQCAKEEWERTFDSVPDLIAILDDQHRIMRINRAMADILHREPSQCIGLPFYTAIDGTGIPLRFCPHSMTMSERTDHEADLSGNYLVTTTPLFDSRGEIYATVHMATDITKLKQIEMTLRENEDRLQLFIEHAPAALAMFDREMRYLCVSRRWYSDYGIGDRKLVGESFYDVFPELSSEWREVHHRGLAGEVLRSEGDRIERADGSAQWMRWEIRPWNNAAGEIGGIVLFSEDITDIKQAEEVLRRYELLAGNSRDIILFVQREDGRILEANAAAVNAYGYGHDELLGLTIRNLRAPETIELTAEQMAEADIHGILFETLHCRKNGSTFPVEVSSQGANIGSTRTLISIIRDVSDRKQTEERLQLQSRMLDSVGQAVIATDLNQSIFYWNKAAVVLFGWSSEEAVGTSLEKLLQPQVSPEVKTEVMTVLQRGESWSGEFDVQSKDGRIIPLLTTNSPVYSEQGMPIAIIGVGTDISDLRRMEIGLRQSHDVLEQRVAERTSELGNMVNALLAEIDEREKAEESLEKSAREIEDLYNLAPCGYHSLDTDGTFVRVNDTELQWLGYERAELVGKMKASDIMTHESLDVFAKTFPRFKLGHDISDLRLSYFRKDGSLLPVLLNASPIMDDNGNYLMSRSTIYNITDLVQAEESIRRLNRLYRTLSETGKVIARIPDRDELFREICRTAVEYGGFRMFWIGLVDDESGLVTPVAAFGSGTDFLENARISALSEPEWMGPTGLAIRNGGHYICNDFIADPCTWPWRIEAEKRGFSASAAFAINLHGATIGTLTMYAAEQQYFDPQIVDLLVQMQEDISFALDNMDREAQRRETERALQIEITERLQAVEALRRQEHILVQQNRHAAMGEMIGNIAHQWRQPLNTLGLFTQRLGFFYGSPSFNKEFLDTSVAKSMEIIQYMSRTIDDFRNFFSTEREKSEFRVIEAVNKALSLVEASFNEHRINIEREEREDVVIYGFPNEYAQVLLNIFINARDAMNEHNVEFPRLKITIGSENGTSVVTIADNAGGIPEDIMDRIFDPYFTTKGPQQGTGIGLFMSKTIVENNMGGRLSVRNANVGAEFKIEV